MILDLKSRYYGALIGVLVGDSLLAKYEGRKTSEIVEDLVSRRGLSHHEYINPFTRQGIVPSGQPTDDSELTYALGEALLVKDFDPNRVYLAMRDFIHGNGGRRKSFLTGGEPYGSGGTLRSALREPTYADSMRAFRDGRVRVVPSNGSLMRNTVVALRYHGDVTTIIDSACSQSCITHIDPMAQAVCIAHAVLCEELLEGYSPREAWKRTRDMVSELMDSDRREADKGLSHEYSMILAVDTTMPIESEIWPHIGGALISFRVALAALLHSSNFEEGLRKVVMVGGDTDTYGAIAGGLLGITYGIESIPQEWSEPCMGRARMLDLADKLMEAAPAL